MSRQVDVVIVVGSPTSSNSNRLAELARKLGVPSYMVDSADELQPEWLEGKSRVGLTAGASAPEVLVDEVIERLRALGAVAVRAHGRRPGDHEVPAAQGPEGVNRAAIEQAAHARGHAAPLPPPHAPVAAARQRAGRAPAREVWLKLEHLQASGSFKARGMLQPAAVEPDSRRGRHRRLRRQCGHRHRRGGARTGGALRGVRAHRVQRGQAGQAARPRRARSWSPAPSMPMPWRPAWPGRRRPAHCSRMPTTSPKWWPARARSRMEIEAQAGGAPDSVLVSVGGGGLVAGIAAWFEDRSRVVALEPELAPTLAPRTRGRRAGRRAREWHRCRFARRQAHRRDRLGRHPALGASRRCCCPTARSAMRSGGCGQR